MLIGIAFADEIVHDRVEMEKNTHSSSAVTTTDSLESPSVPDHRESKMKTEKEDSSTVTIDPLGRPEVKERISTSREIMNKSSTVTDPVELSPAEQKSSSSVRIEEKSSTVAPLPPPAPTEN